MNTTASNRSDPPGPDWAAILKALALFVAALVGLFGGAKLQASQDLPFTNESGAAPTVTATVTATQTVTAPPGTSTETRDDPQIGTEGNSGGISTAESPAPVPSGWITYYAQSVTVGYGGMDFGVKPPKNHGGGDEFRIEGTEGGGPYIRPVYATPVKLADDSTPDANSCKEQATGDGTKPEFINLREGDRFCMYLETSSNGKLAVYLRTREVKNGGLEGTTAKFDVTAWAEASD
ncbi:hypothetical protein [Streptomyces sp. NPDC018693]|uniref:hypothetical protein n=1 Tax=unclassified Streptomyces TaxID=2593676 RepID=UPI0037AE7110